VLDGAVPVSRAIVRLTTAGSRGRTAITDGEGRFSFERLPDGRFTLTASKPAYITSAFGSTRPGRPGTAINLTSGQGVRDIAVQLPKGAVISGVITDASGEPVPGLLVGYLRAGGTQAAAGESYRSDWTTDDRGVYRIYGLEPGSYFVVAGARSLLTSTLAMVSGSNSLLQGNVDAALADLQQRATRGRGAGALPVPATSVQYVGLFHPGTADIGQAVAITVGAGEERLGVDISFTPVPSASIEGTVTAPTGEVPPIVMALTPAVPSRLPPYLVASSSLTVRPGPDGKFRYTGVAPGRYILSARTQPDAQSPSVTVTTVTSTGGSASIRALGISEAPTPDALYATTELTVAGADLSGVTIDLRRAPRVNGRLVFDGAAAPPADLSAVRITLGTSRSQQFVGAMPGTTSGMLSFDSRQKALSASVTRDGSFDVAGVVPDSYTLTTSVPGQTGWRLRSAVLGGLDALDTGLVVTDAPAGELVLTFTDRHNELSGMLQTPAGSPATDYFVAVFTTDRTLWRPEARRLVFTRPATDGRFSFKELPSGEYYLAALTDLDPADWQTPEFLNTVVPASLTFTIADGENKRQDLRLAQ